MNPAQAMEAGRRGLALHHPTLGQDRWITYVPKVVVPVARATSPTTTVLLSGLGPILHAESWSLIDMRIPSIEVGAGLVALLNYGANDDDWTAEEPEAVRARYNVQPAEQGFILGPVQVAMIRQALVSGELAELSPEALARVQLDRELICQLADRVGA